MVTEVKGNELYFARVRESAIIPSKKLEDAGYDVYSNFEGDYFVIEAGKTRPTPTGIAPLISKIGVIPITIVIKYLTIILSNIKSS